MPAHDWLHVDAGTFHDFHHGWIYEIKSALNGGMLPGGFYAMAEQHAGQVIADVLALHSGEENEDSGPDDGGVAVLRAPPRVGRKVVASASATYRQLRKTIAIRHVSGHRIVAMIEIVSPGNKDRAKNVEDFAEKAQAALRAGIHLLLVDLFPFGTHDPHGMHGAIWEQFDSEDYHPPVNQPLMLASYDADQLPEAYLVPFAVGDTLTDMPLFLTHNGHIDVPLEATYQAAFQSVPAVWRKVLEPGSRSAMCDPHS